MQPAIMTFLSTVVHFAIVLGALIVVHEFGHFIVAKKSGVRVERFSVGFGPALWRRQWHETEYRLALVPLGGYVKMYGEHLDETVHDSQGSFLHQSVWKRIPIVAAGPGFNFLFAVILIAFIHLVGVPVEKSVKLGKVLEGSAAAEVGLQSDDTILALDGRPVQRIEELKSYIAASAGRMLQIRLDRAGEVLTVPVTPRKDSEVQEWRIGVELRPGEIGVQRSDPLTALQQGCAWTWRITSLTLAGFAKIVSGAIPLKDSLAGPLGIAREIGRQADQGWRNVVFFAAGISINLAVLNLLPIPVLDGGHLLFFGLEIVLGKPLSLRAREMAQRVGFLILMGLMLLALSNDVRVFYNDLLQRFLP
ncbi:MAG: RIP metalloprotease RseP [Candidatus Tectimicrobiota bacterium]